MLIQEHVVFEEIIDFHNIFFFYYCLITKNVQKTFFVLNRGK